MMNLHFRSGISVKTFSENEISLAHAAADLQWKNPSTALRELLNCLLSQGGNEEMLEERWLEQSTDLPGFYYILGKLKQEGWLAHTLYEKEKPFVSISPIPDRSAAEVLSATLQLSRFAYFRTREGILICETALGPHYFELHHPQALAILHRLASPATLENIYEEFPLISREIVQTFLSLLQRLRFLDDQEERLATWEFHDLIFHTRSRRGRHNNPVGATFRFLDKIPPLPPIKPITSVENIPLASPDIESLIQSDHSFTRILENRKSIRQHGETPISLNQLGKFLYRASRVKGERPAQNYAATARPYPGGGACYELELYPLVHHCEGLEKGLYHYDPAKHVLTCSSPWNRDLEQLLNSTARATRGKGMPQIAILISARFARVTWKYQTMAYAAILKNTGALLQTMYLVATAMDLAPCAVGVGDADLFAKAAKTNYYDETSVGEFILGAK